MARKPHPGFPPSLEDLARDGAFAISAIVMVATTLGLNLTARSAMDTMLFRVLPLATYSERPVLDPGEADAEQLLPALPGFHRLAGAGL